AWIEGGAVETFDMRIDFADVFAHGGGFDVVLANPPYVRQELIRDQKPRLAANFPLVYSGTADLYVYFYARALEMLAPGGMLAFISSNKWFRAAYGTKLRKYVSEEARVVSITDFGDLPVFESATAYPMIFVARKQAGGERGGFLFAQPASLDPPYPDIAAVVARTGRRLPPQAVQGSDWRLLEPESASRTTIMAQSGIPLGEYVAGKIFYGVKTGLNEAFLVDEATRRRLIEEDPASEEIIKPVLLGRDVHRWRAEDAGRWLIFTRRGIDITRYPAILEHLGRWREQLEPRPAKWDPEEEWPGRKPGSYRWYEIQDEVAYHEQFAARKIVFPDIAREPRFALDDRGAFIANTGYVISTDDPYLLAVLNSAAVERFYRDLSAQVRGGYLRFIRQYVERIPIPLPGPRDRDALAELAHRCIHAAALAEPAAEWEAEINDRVASLYGLHAREQAA
ncbi:MAG TPA: TaqI-like C-terminal specificity domain-containing protein, partial [Longimicrobiaceae bacterium]|nr:TaqI-like C-terminal specificity domain-containing protein [Longimicrobiaceae bacterium]